MSERSGYLRVAEIARMLAVSQRTVRRWIKEKKLRSTRASGTRLVSRASLEEFLSEDSSGLLEHSDQDTQLPEN